MTFDLRKNTIIKL